MGWIDEATTKMQRWIQPTPLRPSWGVAAENPDVEDDVTLPFHPSDLSLRQDPEKTLNTRDVADIARARRQAESYGIITPELGEYLLPMAMIEGWGSTMGVKNDNSFYASTRFKKMTEQMGLKKDQDYTLTKIKGEPRISPIVTKENGPRWAATVLGEKSRLKGVVTPEDAVKRYNGKGTATEYVGYDDTPVPADVSVYWKKIQKAQELLEHPKNSSIFNHFNNEYGRLRSYLAPGK